MAENIEKQGTPGGTTRLKSAGKQARLAEALRANLRRRKEQSRERRAVPPEKKTP